MEQYTDEQLDNMLGTGSKQFQKFRVISVDNGTTLAGADATGDFVEKQYIPETKTSQRIPFAPKFEGIILSSQAQLVDKAKVPTWKSDEFDASDKNAQIAIYPLRDGKFIKDIQTNKFKKTYATYNQIKSSRKITQPDGSTQSTYNYFVILYLGVEDEIIKLRFKGTARGNYFDYCKSVNALGAKIYNILTEFSTYIDESTGKYTINFNIAKDAKGIPLSVDYAKIRAMRIQIAKNLQMFADKQLKAPEVKQITDNSPIRDDEIVKELSEIPFEG